MFKTVHCPWCGKDVRVHNQRIGNHLENSKKKCVWTGQPIETAIWLYEQNKERREKAEAICKKKK